MKCPTCSGPMKPLFTSWFCPRDCDRPAQARPLSFTVSRPIFSLHPAPGFSEFEVRESKNKYGGMRNGLYYLRDDGAPGDFCPFGCTVQLIYPVAGQAGTVRVYCGTDVVKQGIGQAHREAAANHIWEATRK
jgi:hypothetical protein